MGGVSDEEVGVGVNMRSIKANLSRVDIVEVTHLADLWPEDYPWWQPMSATCFIRSRLGSILDEVIIC